ncbi:lamin tail domain-containing protein [Spongiactinospora sp. TRM90649]|uniref:lamin tail domain-containing protein n=1 Tax=Spongiactinospora sp. TRM90649 TaxID=3031114 RepID=UPI0023F897C2|nr:lamin tail domain-containing protein [Spongiactinospora sp. TRM90649]MDF5755778.1 lamin tail domain-containing protein [Spongiactinospora sp. TRM90649]
MGYTLLRGEFVIRYPDLPRQGPEPDGDTVKFRPDSPTLVEGLSRPSGTPPGINARGISVRLEAIDALETHFGETHQELAGANAARDELLRLLGFTNVVYFPDLPNKVQSADQDTVRGHVLSNGIDANGRLIAFAFAGEHPGPDGSVIFLDEALTDTSANAALLAAGLAYPAFYATLPAVLRDHLAAVSRAARAAAAPTGLWPRSVADPDGAATVADLDALQALVVWPKLFRRIVPYLAAGNTGFDGFDAWLRADPVHRDDELFLLDRLERGNIHDVVRASGQRIQLTVWPEDFVISPDPALPGTPTTPKPAAVGDLLIVAALPDPLGADRGHETVTLLNTTAREITLTGWNLADTGGGRQGLGGVVAGGAVTQITLGSAVQLGNTGDALTLTDPSGALVDQVSYKQDQVKAGRTICFGR